MVAPNVVELLAFRGFRWWTVEKILASDEVFVPRELGTLLVQLRRDGPPEQPFEVGV